MRVVSRDNPVRQLWQDMREVSPFPKGVADVREPIPGTAFFPGGFGLWLEGDGICSQFPIEQIMVVGQDFNSKRVYEQAHRDGTEVLSSATWKSLVKLLDAQAIHPDRCFFTNLYMGLRDERPETGRFPGVRDQAFVQRCIKFFKKQLELARPKLIVTLGLEPFRVLATNLFQLSAPETLTSCTEIYPSVSLEHGKVVVVALTHPSFYGVNVRHRRYAQLTGAAAEKAMIAEGLRIAFPDE